MSDRFFPPILDGKSFTCPHCGVFAVQNWYNVIGRLTDGSGTYNLTSHKFASCTHCQQVNTWINGVMVDPGVGGVPLPNDDLPDDIKADYIEARDILSKSPRGAAALLRLAIQKLCKHLGEKGKNINDDIAALVLKGLPKRVQQSLDLVRVIGNGAVHPGQIDISDDPGTASTLFRLVNLITDVMITQPKEVEKLYNTLPETKRSEIEKRDASA